MATYRIGAATAPIFGFAAAIALLSADDAGAQGQVHDIRLGHHSGMSLSTKDADTLIGQMNGVMAYSKPPCDVRFRRNGAPAKYNSALPSIVSSKAAFNSFASSPYSVHIVEAIYWCGGPSSGGVMLGCASHGGPVLVVRSSKLARATVHEIGHAQELGHSPTVSNLMYRSLTPTSRDVNAVQCSDAYGKAQTFALDGDDAGPTPQDEPIEALPTPTNDDELRAFLQSGWLYPDAAIPAILALSPEQVQTVRGHLAGDDQTTWANALTVLGLRGTNDDVGLIRQVLETSGSDDVLREAKLSVPAALGYLSYTAKSKDAADLLTSLVVPGGAGNFFQGSPDSDQQSNGKILTLSAIRNLPIAQAAGFERAGQELAFVLENKAAALSQFGADEDFVASTMQFGQIVMQQGLVPALQIKPLQ